MNKNKIHNKSKNLECKEGKERNPETGKCRKICEKNHDKKGICSKICEEDQERNPETGRFKKSPNMPDDILYKILSKLSLKNMITFLYLSKEYEDIRQIIKKS